jgi:8-oxo-dGTP diphosphatase
MVVTDPREQYGDLVVRHHEEDRDADSFAETAETEMFQRWWSVATVVLDDREHILLVYNTDDEQWLAPGGAIDRGETLSEAARREVYEEIGVHVSIDRPHEFHTVAIYHDDERIAARFVVFGAHTETTTIGTDLGIGDEPISDARWFRSLPETTYRREMTKRVLMRCRGDER